MDPALPSFLENVKGLVTHLCSKPCFLVAILVTTAVDLAKEERVFRDFENAYNTLSETSLLYLGEGSGCGDTQWRTNQGSKHADGVTTKGKRFSHTRFETFVKKEQLMCEHKGGEEPQTCTLDGGHTTEGLTVQVWSSTTCTRDYNILTVSNGSFD